jgi:hypothetical protein
VGGGVFGLGLSIGRVACEPLEYASHDKAMSTRSMVPSDVGRDGTRKPSQVRR